jgi:tetratricopeptide (TPR) repeat protein
LEEGDEAPVAIEFAPGEDPEVSFAGLEAGVEELDSEALGEADEEPLEFDDEAALDAGEAEPTPAMEREPPQAEGATPELPRATEVALEADALAEPPQPVEEERLLESASRTNVETPAEAVAVVETRSRRTPPSPQAAPLRAEVAAVVEDATDLVAPTEDVAEVPAVVAAAEDPLAGVITLEAGAFDPEESFDLAAELSDVLSEDAGATASAIAKEEQTGSLETLFSEFKRGVERTLGAGDVETHFDLGIAYREMGLFDDAIGEFQHALGSENRRLDALHLMALCALELGRPADATAHLEQALSSAEWPEDREAPLRFDLAHAYVAVGDAVRALDAFRRVAEIDPGFGDVGAQIAALEDERGGADGKGAAQETYESFDDLIDATAEPDTSADEGMENFEEFQDFDADAEAGAEEPEEAVDPDPAENRPTVRRRRKVSFI